MNIWVYWDNIGCRQAPGYIKLCLKSLINYCGHGHSIHIINKSNIEYYVERIPSALRRVDRNIYGGSVRGFARRLNRRKRASSRIAIRLDYIRLRLLYEYGGLWLDADCITMSDYGPVEDALRTYEIVGVAKNSHGDNHIANNFLAANRKSERLGEIIQEQEELINKVYLEWGEIGGPLLAKRLLGYDGMLLFTEKKVLPLPWQEAYRFFNDEPVGLVERYNPMCCMLYNNIFPPGFKNKGPAELRGENTLISKLLEKHAA